MRRTVLSASRRTDIPAFYMPWFMKGIAKGAFEIVNPYNGMRSTVAATPRDVHSIVFWSKDFGSFLTHDHGHALVRQGYGLFFNFTINSSHPVLEPNVPPLKKRIQQLEQLVRAFGPECVNWRFDPICYYQTASGEVRNNLAQFEYIAQAASRCGVSTCITSVMDHYAKVRKRFERLSTLTPVALSLTEQAALLTRLAKRLDPYGIQLQTCCEKAVLDAIGPDAPITPSACIPGPRLARLYGDDISLAYDKGQRHAAGCRCTASRDIGNYRLHPCRHNCLFCYANPEIDNNYR